MPAWHAYILHTLKLDVFILDRVTTDWIVVEGCGAASALREFPGSTITVTRFSTK